MLGFNNELIVMSLADGNAENINSIGELSIVGRDCMRGLMYMHMHGNCMMHADLKPENILVYKDRDGVIYRAVLGDLGLSRACNINSGFLGTPGYMPDDDIPHSGFDDIFALGVSLLDSSFHDELVHTSHRTHPKHVFITDNTFEKAGQIQEQHDKMGKIISFMLAARTSAVSRAIELTIFMNSLVNGFEEIVNDYILLSKDPLVINTNSDKTYSTQPLSPVIVETMELSKA